MMNSQLDPAPKSRRRLPAELRVSQILDAALAEFSARGYAATRMDDIAQRAQLSKGGLYVHFTSKEEVLSALLDHWLRPIAIDPQAMLSGVRTLRELAERLVSHIHAALAQPALMITFRLLMAEGARLPDLIERWGRDSRAQQEALAELIALAAERGLCRPQAAAHAWLLLSPAVHALVAGIVSGREEIARDRQWRAGHIEMLCALLAPPEPAAARLRSAA
ncbi:TetR/AcrR family transcriptional regulator [Bordetella genomosp. 12]|uniref:TetR family transcriptional regulator n=1 Tax=Bordetella genomosp. 12 TaxID=463035 RepID=A0A261VLZ8_9BORD|nr:TetR/AcrR family transcriptional regulator [Bordetella genomosp. 12]OZI74781.1 TetR family transcriptional regulator [Bordetella genomosp. 12]